jgi:hypothetical protein
MDKHLELMCRWILTSANVEEPHLLEQLASVGILEIEGQSGPGSIYSTSLQALKEKQIHQIPKNIAIWKWQVGVLKRKVAFGDRRKSTEIKGSEPRNTC